MFRRFWRPAMLAVAAALVSTLAGSASDTIRLGGKFSLPDGGAATTLKDAGATLQRLDLKPTDQDNVEPVHYKYGWGGYRGWGGWGGYRGFYGGYGYRGFNHIGYYGGYRGFNHGYYRPYFSIGFGGYPRYFGYGGYWGGFYPRYWGGYWGGYYPSYYSYYSPVYSSYYSTPLVYGGYYWPIGGTIATQIPAITLEVQPRAEPQLQLQPQMPQARDFGGEQPIVPAPKRDFGDERPIIPAPKRVPQQNTLPAPADGTFPYDGGPARPVPMPRPDLDAPPSKAPNGPATPAERMVSIPSNKKPYAYPAYGDHKAAPPKPDDGSRFVQSTRSPSQ